MRYLFLIFSLTFYTAFQLYAQGIRDSVFNLGAVEVTAEQVFMKEEAGSKQTNVDTVILQEKVNLSLSDIISENTSVFIKNHGRGALATASFRGTAPSHTQITWNGITINSPMAGMVDFSLIPVCIIDELSLKHGGASVADRGGGIGGSINISNRVRWQERNSISYMQGVGSYTTFDEYLQSSYGNEKIRIRTRLYHNYSKNDYTFINRGIGTLDPVTGEVHNPVDTNDHASFMRYGLLQEVHLRPHTDHMVSVIYWCQHADRTIPRPTSYEGPDNANLNNQQDRDHKLVTHWKYYSGAGRFMVRSGYSGKQLGYLQKDRIPGLGMNPTVYSVSQQHSFLNSFSWKHDPDEKLSVEAKLDADHHRVDSRDTVSRIGYRQNRNEISLFGAASRTFSDRLNIHLMARLNWASGERIPIIPYLGMDYRLIEGMDLILKGNISRNYHLPSLNDLYWVPGGNPDLLPEDGFTLESGLEFQRMISGHRFNTGLTIYRSDINNWIIWIPSNKFIGDLVTIRNVLSRGMEYDLKMNGLLGPVEYNLSGTYAFTRSVNHGDPLVWGDVSHGKQLPYIPVHSGNLMVRFSYSKFYVTYQYSAYSERFTTSSNDLTRRDWLYPYFMNDLSAGIDFTIGGSNLVTECKIYNLFNETYHSILYRPMPGRNFHMVVKLKI